MSSALKDRNDGEGTVMGETLVYEAVLSTHFAAPVLATLSSSSPRGRNNDQDSQAVFSNTQLTPAKGGKQRPGSPSFGSKKKACFCSLLFMGSSVKTLLKYLVCLSILYPLGSFQSSKWSKMSSLSSLICCEIYYLDATKHRKSTRLR